jgi:hypothetical protein
MKKDGSTALRCHLSKSEVFYRNNFKWGEVLSKVLSGIPPDIFFIDPGEIAP